jgi:hypothetical protein
MRRGTWEAGNNGPGYCELFVQTECDSWRLFAIAQSKSVTTIERVSLFIDDCFASVSVRLYVKETMKSELLTAELPISCHFRKCIKLKQLLILSRLCRIMVADINRKCYPPATHCVHVLLRSRRRGRPMRSWLLWETSVLNTRNWTAAPISLRTISFHELCFL